MINTETERSRDQKQKLTLGISKDVIEKAKSMDINISALTEQVLRAVTYDPKGNTVEDIVNAYDALLNAILPILKKYGAYVQVGVEPIFDDAGGVIEECSIRLTPHGLYKDEPDGTIHKVLALNVVNYLDSPKRILENLIPALIRAAEKNKAKINEFEIAMKFVEILPDDKGDAK